MTSNIKDRIEKLVLPILERLGYKLWGCQCLLSQKQPLIRIFIDKPEGILIDDCEKASRAISAVFDVEDVISLQYRLEISSPGLPKPLFYPWQYQENIGKQAKIKLIRVIEGNRWISGIILTAKDEFVEIQMADQVYPINWTNISKATLDEQ
jgi:ribosome maturation factor RimP